MKVAYYVDDCRYADLAKLSIAAARANIPGAEIIHITTHDGPDIGADEVINVSSDIGFAQRRAIGCALAGENTLVVDCDVIIREDVSGLLDDDYDIGVTTDMFPGAPEIKYNAGVVFVRNPGFYSRLAAQVEGLAFGDWRKSEGMFTRLADSGEFKLKVFPGEEYNHVPRNKSDIKAQIVHFRGGRKRWML